MLFLKPSGLRVSYIKKTSAFEFIQSWIEEAKRRKAFLEAMVINEWEDSTYHWSWGLEQNTHTWIMNPFLRLFNVS